MQVYIRPSESDNLPVEPVLHATLVEATYLEFVTGHATHSNTLEDALTHLRNLPKQDRPRYRNMIQAMLKGERL